MITAYVKIENGKTYEILKNFVRLFLIKHKPLISEEWLVLYSLPPCFSWREIASFARRKKNLPIWSWTLLENDKHNSFSPFFWIAHIHNTIIQHCMHKCGYYYYRAVLILSRLLFTVIFFSGIIVCLGIGYLLDGKTLEIPPLFS